VHCSGLVMASVLGEQSGINLVASAKEFEMQAFALDDRINMNALRTDVNTVYIHSSRHYYKYL